MKMRLKNLMMSVLVALLVVGAVWVGGCAGSEVTTPVHEKPPEKTIAWIIEDVTPQEAFDLIQDNEDNPDFIILDVRTPQEFTEGHIEGAINIDFYADTFRDEVAALDRDKTYLVYCRSGNRSSRSVTIMDELNFREIYHVLGGIIAWEEAGLPIEK